MSASQFFGACLAEAVKYEGYLTRGIMHQLQRIFTENIY